jgi:hypothetical protein
MVALDLEKEICEILRRKWRCWCGEPRPPYCSCVTELLELMHENWEESANKDFEEYLRRFKDNKIVWEKQDSDVPTWLTFWEKPLICETKGCGKETHLSSHGIANIHHLFCEEHYNELHAYHLAILRRDGKACEGEGRLLK